MWTLIRLISCTLLLGSSSSAESRPHATHEETPDVISQQAVLVEAVKMGILSSLGMDSVPELTHKASKQELRRMYRLYRETLRDMRGNSSQPTRDIWQTTTSSVLVPATVKVLRRGERPQPHQHMQWHRAVFHKNPDIQAEVTLARAELKISRQILNKPTSAQPALGHDVQVNVKPMTPAARSNTYALIYTNVSNTQDVRVDVRPKVEQWMRNGAGGSLVVDVGTVVNEREALGAQLDFSLEFNFIQPKPTRTRFPRSDKEDDCSDQGWCCRKSVTVSFKDIGWSDWVVAPTEYTMHLCDGTCPHNYKPASMHTQVKSRLYQLMKGRTPRPCCVPASYEPMVLMHYDSRGKLMLTPFDDLIVSKCHCA